jgi:tetratricopeptide (TPR) repeat protein
VLLRLQSRFLPFVLGLIVLLLAAPAMAAGEDAAARDTLQQVMSEDYPANLKGAQKKLQDALSSCLKKGCSGPVKAELQVALGMCSSQLGNAEEAKNLFKAAIASDPNAKLPEGKATPDIKKLFADAKAGDTPPPKEKGGGDNGGGDNGGGEEPGGGLAATIALIKDALKADQEGRLDECIEKDKQALKIDDSPRTRLHLASCEARAGKLVDALKDAEKSLEAGIQKKDASVMKIARTRVQELLKRIPHITFDAPTGIKDLRVTFDERSVPNEALTKKFSVDPGKHKVLAEGTVNGFTSQYEEELDIKDRDQAPGQADPIVVHITLKPPANDFITPGQIKCMLAAKSQEEVQKCLPQNQKPLVIRIAGDLSGYSDTNAVAVYTPALNASLVSPTGGWNVGGNFALDAVSAASPDLVSTASPPFAEYRYAGGLTGGYKPGLYGAQVNASASSSPDYVSYTAGGTLTGDFREKLVTVTAGYTFSYDRIGRGPNGNWLHDFLPNKGYIYTHEISSGVTFIINPTSIALIGGTFAMERGDGSQPYRYIPTFDADNVAPFVPVGATVDLVNRTRLPVKPLEQLPTERDRIAIGGRFNKRLQNATFRIEQRLYIDTWGMKASSTDSRYMVDLSRHLRVWPHGRLHVQTDTNFYSRAYTAALGGDGQTVVPLYRTGDRELSPLITGTAGGGARLGIGEPEGDIKLGITATADVMYTRFLNSLYITTRTAVYGSVGFDVEF